MTKKQNALGFGYIPEVSTQYFNVEIHRGEKEPVRVYEAYGIGGLGALKIELSKHKWKALEEALMIEFNNTLKGEKLTTSRFKIGNNRVEHLLGKEMMVLLWAIEDCDPSVIPTAIRNWRGLMREERWWLYTMTNACCGDYGVKFGWRKALRYALTENPIADSKQITLLEYSINQQIR